MCSVLDGRDMVLDLRETSKTCSKPSSIVLTGVNGNTRIVKVDCNDRWNCEYCREKFARKARQKVEKALAELGAMGDRCFGYMVTFTLDRQAERYGKAAVGRLSKAVNLFNAALRRVLPYKECIKLKVRAYEQHADGAWHAHMVIVSRAMLPVRAIAYKHYDQGLFQVKFITGDDGIQKALRYSTKYCIKSSETYVSRLKRVKGVRLYAISGQVWKHVKRLDYKDRSKRKGLRIWTRKRFMSWVNTLKPYGFFAGRSVVLSQLPSDWRDGIIFTE